MRKLIIFIFIISPTLLFGQQAPDNEAILREIMNSSSPYYYPTMYLRYLDGDTTLTLKHYHHLYYGFAYQDAYRPLEPMPVQEDFILGIFEKNNKPDADMCKDILRFGNEVMKYDPFNPRNINFLTYACGVLADGRNEKVNHDRFEKIIATIKASGSGLKENSPWHILYFSHANDVLATMDLSAVKRTVLSRTVEFAQLAEKKDGVKGYFFDFSRLYWKRPEKLPEKRSPGWEFNGMKIGSKK